MPAPLKVFGVVFGRLTVLGDAPKNPGSTARRVYFRCVCGKTKTAYLANITRGDIRSCGCIRNDEEFIENLRSKAIRHGDSGKAEYIAWSAMKQRCLYVHHRARKNYGGRGISVCQEWLDSYEAFLRDMGPRPSDAHSIDRIDVDGDYCPGNCRWATTAEQGRNKRNTVMLTAFGQTKPLPQWAEERGIKYHTLAVRIYNGWSHEDAVGIPTLSQSEALQIRNAAKKAKAERRKDAMESGAVP